MWNDVTGFSILFVRRCIQAGLVIVQTSLFAQFTYVNDQSIPVFGKDAKSMKLPWTGGVNAAQFNTMDLNGDGKDDLVIYDRMASKLMTFLNINSAYQYAPSYERYFPTEISNFILLKDYNGDGKKDIFTGDIFGMKVYRNVSVAGGYPQWVNYYFYGPGGKTTVLLTKGFNNRTNIQLQFDDLPTLIDVDQDGDLDLFNVRFSGNGSVEFHKNFSFERYGKADSLDFERITQAWGGVTQCFCENFVFNDAECFTPGGRVQHGGGKALLAIDLDNDNDHELLYSEGECSNLFALTNQGTNEKPVFNSANVFPASPVVLNTFPAAFHEDVDFDGIKDLIISPNIYRKESLEQDLASSTWLYKNTGSNSLPEFTFVKNSFLQDQMIDVGDNAVPAFFDADGDQDLDLFIGSNSDATTVGTIFYYENIGTVALPAFQLVSEDYANIKSLRLSNVKIQIADLNGDGQADLTFSATTPSTFKTAIYYLINTTNKGMSVPLNSLQSISVPLEDRENFHFAEINHDGKIDLLIGRFTGSLEYWQNIGSAAQPQYYLAEPAYLNITSSLSRQGIACFVADLNNDQKDDLIISNQVGKITVIGDFHGSENHVENEKIIFNPLKEEYQSTALGRSWPTAAALFESKRPAIVAGTIRGGLEIFRNEEKDVQFNELSLKVYPNPVKEGESVFIESNLPLILQVYTVQGQKVSFPMALNENTSIWKSSGMAKGMYIFKFTTNNQHVYRRIIIQ